MCEKPILAPINETEGHINEKIMSLVKGYVMENLSVDNVMKTKQITSYSVTFLSSQVLLGDHTIPAETETWCSGLVNAYLDAPRIKNLIAHGSCFFFFIFIFYFVSINVNVKECLIILKFNHKTVTCIN